MNFTGTNIILIRLALVSTGNYLDTLKFFLSSPYLSAPGFVEVNGFSQKENAWLKRFMLTGP